LKNVLRGKPKGDCGPAFELIVDEAGDGTLRLREFCDPFDGALKPVPVYETLWGIVGSAT